MDALDDLAQEYIATALLLLHCHHRGTTSNLRISMSINIEVQDSTGHGAHSGLVVA